MATNSKDGLNVGLPYIGEPITVTSPVTYNPIVVNPEEVRLTGYTSSTNIVANPLVLSTSLFTRAGDSANIESAEYILLQKPFYEQLNYTYDSITITTNFGRTFLETIDATDDILGEANIDDDQTALVQKVLLGGYSSSDLTELTVDFNRNYHNFILKSDISYILFNKAPHITARSSDLNYLSLDKPFADLTDSSDYLSIEYYKPYNDTAVKSDVTLLNIQPSYIDTVNQYDSTSYLVDFKRTFIEYVNPTDDVLGEANIDDDQTAFVQKVLIDTPTYTDSFSTVVLYHKLYNHYTHIEEVFSLNPNKNQHDTLLGSTDTIEKLDIIKGVTEEYTTLDWIVVNTSTVLSPDTYSLNDSSIVFLDSQLKSDTISSSDFLARTVQYTREYLDFVNPTDDVLGSANIDDDQTAFVNKGRLDTTISSDAFYTTNYFNRYPDEAQVITDITYITIAPYKQDTVNSSTLLTFSLVKPDISDQVSKSDNVITTTEYSREFVEPNQSISDISTNWIQLAPVETLSISDVIQPSLVYFSYPQEIPSLIESISLVANTIREYVDNLTSSDIPSLEFYSPQADSINGVADATVYSIQPEKLETVLTDETRTANIQDYVIPGYAEVGYVGTDLTL